jgi:hypothetical protein
MAGTVVWRWHCVEVSPRIDVVTVDGRCVDAIANRHTVTHTRNRRRPHLAIERPDLGRGSGHRAATAGMRRRELLVA